MNTNTDSICALATASGRSGIGIIRISGALAEKVAEKILKTIPSIRQAKLLKFYDQNDQVLDQGIVVFFKAPYSFTGEDVLELQAHGGPVLLDLIMQEVLNLGVRLARPGEFSERAFLNNKIDLAQAEAIADVIDAASEKALRLATQSLQGVFSKKINSLVEALINLRMFVESAIDFPEEEIDFIGESDVSERLLLIKQELKQIFKAASSGQVLREGLTVVIAGQPNVGKSSLLNQLAEKNTAIVTDIPGTTRDILKESIQIDGIPLHILDTAGLRESEDVVEQEGIRRAWIEIEQADCVLLVLDDNLGKTAQDQIIFNKLNAKLPIIEAYNKVDISGGIIGLRKDNQFGFSAKTGDGLNELKNKLKQIAGFSETGEGLFLARRRHLQALEKTQAFVKTGYYNLKENGSAELLAEDLRLAQQSLAEITGKFSSDDLLGEIFSRFCIGK